MRFRILSFILILITIISVNVSSYAQNVVIEADKQVHNGETGVTTFEGNVKVQSDDITVTSPKALVTMDENGNTSNALFLDGAYAIKDKENTKSEVKANIIKLSLISNKINAEGDVISSVKENEKPVVIISADNQEFDMDANIMKAHGSVEINYKELVTNSNQATININKDGTLKKVKLYGDAQVNKDNSLVKAKSFLFNPQTNELIAIGRTYSKTILEDNTKVAVWADQQQYDQKSNVLLTSGNVKISYKDYVATGPKASFLPDDVSKKPNRILFFGRSRIQEGTKIIEADRIEITVNPKNFNAEGNVRTKFTQVKSLNEKSKKKSL